MEISKNIRNPSFIIAIILIVIGISFRLLPHEANFAPVAAIAIFSGALLERRFALWVPLAIMALSDFIIGGYGGMMFTWAAFLLIALYGMLFRQAGFMKRVAFGAFGSAGIFFIVSNFGVWVSGGLYPPSFAGLVECYYMALPFLRATLLSDLLYSGLLFGLAMTAAQPFIVRSYGLSNRFQG